MGLAIAHQLSRQGTAVTVLSRRRSEAAGFVAAGMLAPHAEGLSGDLLRLGQTSLKRVPSWVLRSRLTAASRVAFASRASWCLFKARRTDTIIQRQPSENR